MSCSLRKEGTWLLYKLINYYVSARTTLKLCDRGKGTAVILLTVLGKTFNFILFLISNDTIHVRP